MNKFSIALALAVCAHAAIIDRTAVVVGRHAILDSDIRRDLRIVAFLNGEAPEFGAASRKQAASRLIDQELIREQVRAGNYPYATESEARAMLANIQRERFGGSEQALDRTLERYGISEAELLDRLVWQLTVLRFIDIRFRPAAVVSDQEIEQYYNAHRAQIKTSLEAARPQIVEAVTGERVNNLLDEWLRQARGQAHVEFLEPGLQ